MLLEKINIVLLKTRFPENVGMIARACANMGLRQIILVQPELWDVQKARPLATAKGHDILNNILVVDKLSDALAHVSMVLGTTARTGGWRREWLNPEQGAVKLINVIGHANAAILFGPENRGLNNEEISICNYLVTIPTEGEASSLNVAQAALLMLYECRKLAISDRKVYKTSSNIQSRLINIQEQELLHANIKEALLLLDYLHGANPDYFLLPFKRFLGRVALRRHEYDALMGICRQIKNKVTRA